MINRIKSLLLLALIGGGFVPAGLSARDLLDSSPAATADLKKGFQNPPLDARPRVFRWWLNSIGDDFILIRDFRPAMVLAIANYKTV